MLRITLLLAIRGGATGGLILKGELHHGTTWRAKAKLSIQKPCWRL